MSVRAVVVDRAGTQAAVREVDPGEPDPGTEALLDVTWSSLNYKDALAVAGRPGVIRSYPLVAGIDAVGEIESASAGPWHRGDPVVVTGAGLGERRAGGFAERTVVPLDAAVALPPTFSALQAAAIGTAGFTAALAVLALEEHGPLEGPVLVTGAGGGVGGFATALLAARGHEVAASTGRRAELGSYLTDLGAASVDDRLDAEPGRPLQSARWAGVVDSVGGGPLVNAIAGTAPGGAVAACGLAGGSDLAGTVLPFILRGVALLGIDSVGVLPERRAAAWRLLEQSLEPRLIGRMVQRVVGLGDVVAAAQDVLEGRIRGRVLVDTRR